jgi:hypothetical protein
MATLTWSKRAGVQALVVWQVSHVVPLAMWLLPLPGAVVPLWQLTQLPETCKWSTRSRGDQAPVPWQLSQLLLVATWVVGLPMPLAWL